jgi:hypothetical protein
MRRNGKLDEAFHRSFASLIERELVGDLPHANQHTPDVTCIVRCGNALRIIDEEIRMTGADLLIVGVRGTLGPVATAFLYCPPCDVLFQPARH